MMHVAPLFSILFLLCSCKQPSQADFRSRAHVIELQLIQDLQKIDDIDGLIEAESRLEAHFNALVDVMIEARKWQIKNKVPTIWKLTEEDHEASRKLALELNRLLRNPLARHFLEKAQAKALERLDAFEKKYRIQNAPSQPSHSASR